MKLKDKVIQVPIIQGGMGVGISLGSLAGSVAKEGAIGVLSAAQPGFSRSDFKKNPLVANCEAIKREVQKAKSIADGNGIIAMNIMVAGYHYQELVEASIEAGIDAIISGAGIPLDLPKYTKDTNVLIAPIVSSGRALEVLLKAWYKRYQRMPDFIVCEGPKAGGHLGFSKESLDDQSASTLEEILSEVQEVIKEYGVEIPIFVGGGIYTGYDIAYFQSLGATGVQMGTRFITTVECDANIRFKEMFLKEQNKEISLVVSPAKLPGRAFKTKYMDVVMEYGSQPVKHCYRCLQKCNPQTTPYCISEALIEAVKGNVEDGLVFTGTNGGRATKIDSVKECIEGLVREMIEAKGELQ